MGRTKKVVIEVTPAVSAYMKAIGSKGGLSLTEKKLAQLRAIAKLPRKRHVEGCACHACVLKRIRARSGK